MMGFVKGKYKRDLSEGLIHIYTGAGKGKTSASLGMALRQAGHNRKVCIIQFMKGATYLGELIAINRFLGKNIEIYQFGRDCTRADKVRDAIRVGSMVCGSCRDCFSPFEEEQELTEKAMKFAAKMVSSGKYHLVVLDEILNSLRKGMVNNSDVLKLMLSKAKKTELILTGRGAPEEIIVAADYVTEMQEIKHPMYKGIPGRIGVEY